MAGSKKKPIVIDDTPEPGATTDEELPPKKAAKKTKTSDASSSSKAKKAKQAKEDAEEEEEGPPKRTKTLPGCMNGEMLTAITTSTFLGEMPYKPTMKLHFDTADKRFVVTIKPGVAKGLTPRERSGLSADVDLKGVKGLDCPGWLRKLIQDSDHPESDNITELVLHTFKKPVKVYSASYQTKSRWCIKPGIAPRENKAEIEVKILRLIFEGHEDEAEQVDISADRANSGNGIDETAEELAAEIMWPCDVDCKKTAS